MPVPGNTVPNAAETPAADSQFSLQHRAHARADGQVGVTDDGLGDAAGAVVAGGAHGGDAIDEFHLAHRPHFGGAVLAVHGLAFQEHGGNDIVAAADIGQQIGQKIPPSML